VAALQPCMIFMPAIEYRLSVGTASVVLFAGGLLIAPWLTPLHRNSQGTRSQIFRRHTKAH
jgi:hypothetical protein